MIQALLISIVARKYADQPQSRANAARLLLIYGLQLAIRHLGPKEARRIAEDAFASDLDVAA